MRGPSYTHNRESFSKLTDESAYWIGFVMADGWVSARRGNAQSIVAIKLHKRDASHLEKFKEFIGSSHPIREYGDAVQIQISSNALVEDLARWGVVPRKSLTAKAHSSLENNPHFWRGVIDGDGCLSGDCLLLYGSESLCSQFLGYVNSLHPTHATVRPHKSIYVVRLRAKYYTPHIWSENCKYLLDRKKP